MDRKLIYKIGTVAAPVLCCCFAVGIGMFEFMRLTNLRYQEASGTAQISDLQNALRDLANRPKSARVPVVADSNMEQAQFVNALRVIADTSKVSLVRWSVGQTAPTTGPGSATKGAPGSKFPTGVSPMTNLIEINGTFAHARTFLYNLARYRRLLALDDLHWQRTNGWPVTDLSFTVTRFIVPAGQDVDADPDIDPQANIQPLQNGPAASNGAAAPIAMNSHSMPRIERVASVTPASMGR
ncbi:MAG: hypothetical protein KGJ62_12880 [Armatimonadetes bacterium]|nr:hypothetical protein [Armatimonadota bacterium]MDE2206336.1 hypothetical protein [Armatimonadota bacterium]